MEEKRFDEWMTVKEGLHNSNRLRSIKEGEVWWCGFGENVGAEINGKNDYFARPVVILRKLSRCNFIGIPLTSKRHEGTWYVSFVLNRREQVAVVAQIRNLSVARLYRKIGELPDADFDIIKDGLRELLF